MTISKHAAAIRRPQASGPRRARQGDVLLVMLVVVAVLALVVILWITSQSRAPEALPPQAADTTADQIAREKATAWFAQSDKAGHLDEALGALAPLLARGAPALEDLIAAAIIARAQDRDVDARQFLQRVLEREAANPRAHYMLGRLAMLEGKFQDAAEHLRQALAGAPDDVPCRIALAQAIEEASPREAEKLYRSVIERGVDNTGSWYMTAVFRLAGLMRDTGRDRDFERYLTEFQQLSERGMAAPKSLDEERGNLGDLRLPAPLAVNVASSVHVPSLGAADWILPELANFENLLPCDLDGDGSTDLIGWGRRGLQTAVRAADAGWRTSVLDTLAIDWLIAADMRPLDKSSAKDAPSALDLIAARGATLCWWRVALDAEGRPSWTIDAAPLFTLPSPPSDGLALDFDHEGDLDLALVGGFGVRILRNDGARSPVPGGAFVDVSQAAGAVWPHPLTWVISEDFDTDQDVDLLCGGQGQLLLLSNARGGRLVDLTAEVLHGFASTPVRPLCADLDADARPDLWGVGPFSLAHFNQPSGRFRADPGRGLARSRESRLAPPVAGEAWAGKPPEKLLAADFDLDGLVDAAWLNREATEADVISAQLAIARIGQTGFDLPLPAPRLDRTPALGDLSGDGSLELLRSGPEGVQVTQLTGAPRAALRLTLRGVKDNRRGIGATVELRAGGLYQRTYWRGETTSLGLGEAGAIDWLRVTWPNGVVQYDVRPEPGSRTIEQIEGLIGSCPFLYTWNGTRYEFITDVLGITPLGLPMAPGMLVPPDHDEYVLVHGEQLAPKDGKYEIALTEELREVTYLDRVRLDVVDHPADVEIFPNERFSFPPFPMPHVHTVREALVPILATGSDGGDWTDALAKVDDRYATPFRPAPAQFLGLCEPHWVEVEFEREPLAAAKQLRLLLTGWTYWTDASVNMASARDPGFEFVPPILQVPDGNGGWKDAGPPVGFPAGKTKTMVLDVALILSRDDPRLRILTSLRLSWDSIRLCIDDDDAPLRVTALEPSAAELWRRGFSEAILDESGEQPTRFQWNRLAERARWNPHPGIYTKYGQVLPLVSAVDDLFVVMASGDALNLSFDASALPGLESGWRRDFLVYLDGWAKDRDPNTHSALYVEPLPFHGMSGYPYGFEEQYPRTAQTAAWQREWQTRMPEAWIPRGPR